MRIDTVDVAQLVRASDCGSEGRGFEPLLPPWRRRRGKRTKTKNPYISLIYKDFSFLSRTADVPRRVFEILRQTAAGDRNTYRTGNLLQIHRLLRYLTEYTRQRYRKDDLPLNVVDSLHLPGQTDVNGSDIPFQPAYMAHSGRFGAFRFGTGVPATAAIPSLSASVPATRVPAPKRNSDRRKDRNRASVSVAGADTCRRQTTKRW